MRDLIKFICYFVKGMIFDEKYIKQSDGLKIFSEN